MSNLVQWAAIVAFFVPILVAAINRRTWPPRAKATMFFLISLLAAAGTAYFQGDLTAERWLDAILVIVPAGAAFYHGLLKPVGVIDAVEGATETSVD